MFWQYRKMSSPSNYHFGAQVLTADVAHIVHCKGAGPCMTVRTPCAGFLGPPIFHVLQRVLSSATWVRVYCTQMCASLPSCCTSLTGILEREFLEHHHLFSLIDWAWQQLMPPAIYTTGSWTHQKASVWRAGFGRRQRQNEVSIKCHAAGEGSTICV